MHAIAVDGLEILFVRQQVVVQQPPLLAIDRNEIARTLRVVDVAHPRARRCDQTEERWRANVARLHALDDLVALELRADGATNAGSPAVTSDQVSAFERERAPGVELDGIHGDAIVALLEAIHARAIDHP